VTIDQCPEPWRVETALGAVFFLLGVRFALLRWRELSVAEQRIQTAVHETERQLRHGVSELRSTVASREQLAHPSEMDPDAHLVVQATSDRPGPLG